MSTFFLSAITFFYSTAFGQSISLTDKVNKKSMVQVLTSTYWGKSPVKLPPIEVVSVTANGNYITVRFSKETSTTLITTHKLQLLTDSIRIWTNRPQADVQFFAAQTNLRSLIPQRDTTLLKRTASPSPVKQLNKPSGSLSGRSFAIWNSHGYCYRPDYGCWHWQRGRLFTTVEDLLSSAFVLPYLVPMLENAGANVYLPRERDMNTQCIIIDNEDSLFTTSNPQPLSHGTGFGHYNILHNFDNPFTFGSTSNYRLTTADSLHFSIKDFHHLTDNNIDDSGLYNIYIAYEALPANSDSVLITIRDSRNITTQYLLNQQIAGSMWTHLGQIWVDNTEQTIDITIKANGLISFDAIRIGGGMGSVERFGSVSKKAAWHEGARYYLQTNGFNPHVYSVSNGTNDYTDDINARGEWVNALIHSKNIPVDAALAIHTDAGIALGDSTIGTLAIVQTNNMHGHFSDGRPKSLSRSLAHFIEQQLVTDLRSFIPQWSERGIWDKNYSEARRPDVPTVLLEMLSHQNLNDIQNALNPDFRYQVCYSIYKAIVRFFEGENAELIPQPTPFFQMHRTAPDSIQISLGKPCWLDNYYGTYTLPDYYVIHRHQLGGDDVIVAQTTKTSVTLHQPCDGKVYEYYVISVNRGGQSFPTAKLSSCFYPVKESASIDFDTEYRYYNPSHGYLPPIKYSANFIPVGIDPCSDSIPVDNLPFTTGLQYNFNIQSEWQSDDEPGWGASDASFEMKPIYRHKEIPQGKSWITTYELHGKY